jgi:hypothetical protein
VRTPILIFTGGLRVYASRAEAETALGRDGLRPLDAFDASGRPLRLLEGGRGWFGFKRRGGVRLEAGATSAGGRRELRARLAGVLVENGVTRKWAEGAPLGALVAEAARRLRG